MSQSDSSSPTWHWPVVLAIPIILTIAQRDWMYSNPSVIDAWVYNGFFRHLEAYATTMFPGTYYGTRLAWILPGYVAYHLFEPRLAAFALHVTFYYLALAAMYGLVRRIAGPSGALFATVAFAWYMPVVRALGSDYVDGAVITYALLAAWLAPAGSEATSWWRPLGAGAATGAMLHSNIGAAFLVPSILVWLVPHPRTVEWSRLARSLALWSGGIVLCTALLSLISVVIGAEWDFFMASFRWMRSQGLMTNPFQPPEPSLISSAPWVFLPAATAVGILVMLLSRRHRTAWTAAQARAVAAFASAGVLFIAWDYVGPGAVLYWPFYNSWLLPWCFVVIGAVLVPRSRGSRSEMVVALLCACAILGSLVSPERVRIALSPAAALAAVAAMFALAAVVRRTAVGLALVAVAIVGLHGWLSTSAWYSRVDDRADAFRAIDEGVRAIERHVSTQEPRFLLTREGPLAHYIQGLTSVYLWGYTIASQDFLAITPQEAARIAPGRIAIVVDERRETGGRFDHVFAPYGLRARVLGTTRVETRHGPLYLTFLEPMRSG